MVRVVLVALFVLASAVAVVAGTPSSFDEETAFLEASRPADPEPRLASN